MQKEIKVAKAGYEQIFEILNSNIENIENAKEVEKQEACVNIDIKYEELLADYKKTLDSISIVEIVEIPEPTEEPSEEQNTESEIELNVEEQSDEQTIEG